MSKVDDELTRRLHRAERPVEADVFERLERRRSHRERVRRVQTAVLAVTVLAATVGGFAALSRAFRETPGRIPGSPEPSSVPGVAEGTDIGLGFNLCNIENLGGIDWYGDGTSGAAWTGVPLTDDGRCPSSLHASYIVSVDLDGNGLAESQFGRLTSCLLCRPYAAADLSGDGVLELVVLEEASSTPTYSVFEISVGERSPGVYPIWVRRPGNARMSLEPGEQLRLTVGGDEGFSGGIRCEGGSPVIEYTWTNGVVDQRTDLEVDVTRFAITYNGVQVRSIDSFSIPRDKIPDLISSEPACGVDFHPAP